MKNEQNSTFHILFTGHMIDSPDRPKPRFPAFKEILVKDEIRKCLRQTVVDKSSREINAIAGGACGGDILFHEVCIELQISSEIYLAMDPETFKKKSVSFSGPDWERRFDLLLKTLPYRVLKEMREGDDGTNVWEDTNNWMLKDSLTNGGGQLYLLALWDRKSGDGNGGTEDLVNRVKNSRGYVQIIDINQL